MANNGYKDEDPAIFIRSDSKQKHTSTGGNMKELKPITESMPKGEEGTEVKAATELKSQLKDEEHREAKAILESLRKGRESRELKATLELLRKFQAGMELMVIRKSPHKDFQHIDTKMFSEELRKVLDGQDRLDEMIIELETKFGLHGNRSDDSHLGEPDGTKRKEKDGEDPVVIMSSAEDRATDDQGKLEAGDDDVKEQFHGEKSADDPNNLSESSMGNKVDYDDDLEMTNLRLEELGSSLIKSKKSDEAVIEDASMKETLDILEGRVEDDDRKTEEFESFKQKMNVNSRKKGLRDWVKDSCKEFDEEKTILIGMMVQAVQVGIQLSNLIVDFVFMMSWQEDIAAKIGEFKSEASNWVIENGRNNSMVIDRIVTLLAMADAEVSHLKKSKREVMIKNKGWTVTALDQGSRVGELLNLFVEQVGKRLLDQLIEISLRLEAIMIVGESSVLALEYDLDECEEDAERIREDISTLKIAFPLKLGIKDSKMIRTRDIVASNIYELWNGLLTDSSDEEQREQPHEVEDDDHPTV